MAPKVRLFLDHTLGEGQSAPLTREQAHYLFNVMRLGLRAEVAVFNGRDGEWRATIAETGKKGGSLSIESQTAPQRNPPDLWLLFAPVKKARTDFIVEKAVEMGVARIIPVQTDFTNTERIRQDRLQAHATEAAEQCGATFVPPVEALRSLQQVLDTWPDDRLLLFCDEAKSGEAADVSSLTPGPSAVLIGPEGGFSDGERETLASLRQSRTISLGPRILRADTAAVAALALWQSTLGDWSA